MLKVDKLRKIRLAGIVTLIILTVSFYFKESILVNSKAVASYKTVTVSSGNYEEKGVLKNLEWKFLRYDTLSIPFSKGNFYEYLVEEGAEVKKGDALISYYISTDSILIEEKKLLLKQTQQAFEVFSKQKEEEMSVSKKNLDALTPNSYECKILKLKHEKMKVSYEQYRYRTLKTIDKQKEEVKELEDKAKLQYVYAPYDGIVHKDERINEGISINNRTELITILDTKSAFLGASISGTQNLWYDMEIFVTSISNMKEDTENIRKGKILSMDSLFEGKVSTGMIYVQLEDNEDMFDTVPKANISGVMASVKNVPIIPLTAVKTENDASYVYIPKADGTLSRRYITGRDNGVYMWVYNGLSIGQIIIAE